MNIKMLLRPFGIAIGAMLLSGIAIDVRAQDAGDIQAILREQRQIIEREEQRRRFERDLYLGEHGRVRQSEPSREEEAREAVGPCVQVERITFDGLKSVSESKMQTQLESHSRRCLTLAELQDVLRLVTNYYVERGYVTSRAYLAPQDLSNGTLSVLVVEGTVQDVQLGENGAARSGAKQLFAPGDNGLLNIRDFEQGLDQINRLGSKNAKIRIEPGDAAGASVVFIDVEDTYWSKVSTGLDNSGAQSTGRHQLSAAATFEDILGLHESLTISTRSSLDRIEDVVYSRSINGYFSIPYQYWTFEVSGSYLDYRSLLNSVAYTYDYEGDSWEIRTGLDRVLFRNAEHVFRLGGAFTLKQANNFIEDVYIDASSQRLAVGEVFSSVNGKLFGGAYYAKASLQQGFDVFAAQSDAREPSTSPTAQFLKASIALDYQRYWQSRAGVFGLVASLNGSVSPDTLFASERVSLGGEYTIRGYPDTNISGDSGGYGRFEFRWRPNVPFMSGEKTSAVLGKPELFAALDAGAIISDEKDPLEKGELVGSAVGVRLSGGWLTGEASYEKALSHPGYIEPKTDGFFRFRLGVSHTF